MIMINICHLWWIKSITISVLNLPVIRMNQNVLKTCFFIITLDNEMIFQNVSLCCFTIATDAICRRRNDQEMFHSGQCERNYQLDPSTFSIFSICINEILLDDLLFMILVLSTICLIVRTTVPLKNSSFQRRGKRLWRKSLCIWKKIARKK